jgi:hypothetical protein
MRSALLALAFVACQLPAAGPVFTPMSPEQASAASATHDACHRVCTKYFDCKQVRDDAQLAQCVDGCAAQATEPERADGLVAMECPAFLAALEGKSAGGANLAGVWVGEEASLTPGIYLRYTQYLTFYPDGSVTYAKAEGGASRPMVENSVAQFRSWREGVQPNGRVIGRWQSDGSGVVVQFSVWNNLRAQGVVRGPNEITLSGMGAIEEGATLTFQRQ